MKIGTSDIATRAAHFDPQVSRKTDAAAKNIALQSDSSKTSEQAVMLSRNMATLRDQLAPRAEILEKFAGFPEKPFEIDDQKLDVLLSKMKEEKAST